MGHSEARNTNMYSMRGKDGQEVRVRRDDELAYVVCDWRFDDLGAR